MQLSARGIIVTRNIIRLKLRSSRARRGSLQTLSKLAEINAKRTGDELWDWMGVQSNVPATVPPMRQQAASLLSTCYLGSAVVGHKPLKRDRKKRLFGAGCSAKGQWPFEWCSNRRPNPGANSQAESPDFVLYCPRKPFFVRESSSKLRTALNQAEGKQAK